VARDFGATNAEAADAIVTSLQCKSVCDFEMTDIVQDMLEQIPPMLPPDLAIERLVSAVGLATKERDSLASSSRTHPHSTKTRQ
jgi:uncharacterized protein YciU (UPF0263 family)